MLTLQSQFQYECYVESPDSYLVMLELATPEKKPKEEKLPPYEICLVIDVSGSMNEDEKLRKVKDAAIYVIKSLPANSIVHLVTFNERSKTIFSKLLLPDEQDEAIAGIEKLEPDGVTNLYSGLVSGLQILNTSASKLQQALFLMTDGQANCGLVTDTDIFNSLQERKLNVDVLHAIGVRPVNQDLLQKLASAYKGNFYLISNTDDIGTCFKDSLGCILARAAIHVNVTVRSNNGGLFQCIGPNMNRMTAGGGTWEFPDILFGEKRNIVFSISDCKKVPEIQVHWNYVNVLTGQEQNDSVVLKPKFGKEMGPLNVPVKVHMLRFLVAKALLERKPSSLQMYRNLLGELPRANPIVNQLLADIRLYFEKKNDNVPDPSVLTRAASLQSQRTATFVDVAPCSYSEDPFFSQSRLPP